MTIETKNIAYGFDFKAKDGKEGQGERVFSGYLAVFGNSDAYNDIIDQGAFAKSLKSWEGKGYYPPMLEQHGSGWVGSPKDNTPVGVWTLMKEDEKGLFVEGKLFDNTRGNDLYAVLKESPKNAIGMSIGYRATRKEIVENVDGTYTRYLKEIDLMEGSIVTYPANDEARIEDVKSQKGEYTVREVEKLLRDGDGGLSQKDASMVIARLKHIGWPITDEKTQTPTTEEATAAPVVEEAAKSEDASEGTLFKGILDIVQAESVKLTEEANKRKVASIFDEIKTLIEK